MTVFLLPYLNIILYYSGFPLRVAATYARQAIRQQEGMSRLLDLPWESLCQSDLRVWQSPIFISGGVLVQSPCLNRKIEPKEVKKPQAVRNHKGELSKRKHLSMYGLKVDACRE